MSNARKQRNRSFRKHLRWHLFLCEEPGRLVRFIGYQASPSPFPWWVFMKGTHE